MATVTATVTKTWHDGQTIHAVGTIAASGTYTTGGDTLSFAGLVKSSRAPIHVDVYGKAGFIYSFTIGATIANGLWQVWTNSAGGADLALTQHSAAALGAAITGDTIRFHAVFEKL